MDELETLTVEMTAEAYRRGYEKLSEKLAYLGGRIEGLAGTTRFALTEELRRELREMANLTR